MCVCLGRYFIHVSGIHLQYRTPLYALSHRYATYPLAPGLSHTPHSPLNPVGSVPRPSFLFLSSHFPVLVPSQLPTLTGATNHLCDISPPARARPVSCVSTERRTWTTTTAATTTTTTTTTLKTILADTTKPIARYTNLRALSLSRHHGRARRP